MSADAIAWAIGLGLPILTAAVLFLANWLRDVSKKAADTAQEVDRLRSHVAENYVRGHEIAEVKKAVADLRTEMTQAVGELRTELGHQLGELTKALYQMIGQQNAK